MFGKGKSQSAAPAPKPVTSPAYNQEITKPQAPGPNREAINNRIGDNADPGLLANNETQDERDRRSNYLMG